MSNSPIGRRNQNSHRSAQLPALPAVKTGNPSLDGFLDAVRERLEVRDGARGDPYERAVTVRDLEDAGLPISALNRRGVYTRPNSGEVGGVSGTSGIDRLLGGSVLFTDLLTEIHRIKYNDNFPDRVREMITAAITDEAKARGADIRTVATKLQSEVESFASTLTELTSSIGSASAGIQDVRYTASAETRAVAGMVTTLAAALEGTGNASFSESVQVIADLIEGLRSSWMIQVTAGGTVSGVSLLASEDPTGASQSAFVVEANKFAVAAPVNFAVESTPSATALGQIWYKPSTKTYFRATSTGTGGWVSYTPSAPFGVDTTTGTVYINGALRVNAGGGTIQDLAAASGRYTELRFKRSATQPATPTLANPSDWTKTVPVNGLDPIYMVLATKNADGSLYGAWSTPVRAFRDGVDGVPGEPGADGQPRYTWIAYANDATGTLGFTTGAWSGHTYIGIASNKTTETESQNKADYTWALIKGADGAAGSRGSLAGYGSNYGLVSNSWVDNHANAVIYNMLNGTYLISVTSTSHLRLGDTVTLSNGTSFAATRYWGGSGWLVPGVVIDGNLLVTGSVTSDRIDTRNLTIKDNAGNVLFGAGVDLDGSYIKDLTVDTLQIKDGAVTVLSGGVQPPGFTVVDTTPAFTNFGTHWVARTGVSSGSMHICSFIAQNTNATMPADITVALYRGSSTNVKYEAVFTIPPATSLPIAFSAVDVHTATDQYVMRIGTSLSAAVRISKAVATAILAKK